MTLENSNIVYAEAIKKDFTKVAPILEQASQVLQKKAYAYPIFMLSSIPIEKPWNSLLLLHKDVFHTRWDYYVTHLGLLIEQNWILETEAFKAHYKDPNEYCCLLVLDTEFQNFIYIPYQ